MQQFQDTLKSLSYSTILSNALRSVAFPTSSLQLLSTINLDEVQPLLEFEEVQNEIEHEISSLQEQTNPQQIIDAINDWANQLIEFHDNIKQKAPAIQDVFKENVLHISEFTSNKPQENAKQVKATLEKDFGIALSSVNKIRVTNRETPVFSITATCLRCN